MTLHYHYEAVSKILLDGFNPLIKKLISRYSCLIIFFFLIECNLISLNEHTITGLIFCLFTKKKKKLSANRI